MKFQTAHGGILLLVLVSPVAAFHSNLRQLSPRISVGRPSFSRSSSFNTARSTKLSMINNFWDSFTNLLSNELKFPTQPPLTSSSLTSNSNDNENKNNNPAVQCIRALNRNDVDTALMFLSDDCEWDDCSFYQACKGKIAVERRMRLLAETTTSSSLFVSQQSLLVVDDVTVDVQRNTVGILFHRETVANGTGTPSNNSSPRGCAMFELNESNTQITRVCIVNEPATKGGEAGLQILSGASRIMKATGYNPEVGNDAQQQKKKKTKINNNALTPPERYFAAWNRRDMAAAVNVFADDLKYEDTAFPHPFVGKAALEAHLRKCSAAFPSEFEFVTDAVAVSKTSATCEWHVENDGEPLPYTQGCSYYKLNGEQKIVQGIDFIEPAVIKPAGLYLFVDSLATKLITEPVRWIAVVTWLAYMYIVFFSDGILPGANALQLESRTWEEVLNLSLNFFLVSPLLNLPFSPSVHPMLEGVFNLLLSWAAMFAGFLSDDRPRKPNLLPMFPIVIGMQLLTSAFLLPYLAVRSSETSDKLVTFDELPVVAQVAGESRVLPALMSVVGSGSIAWFFLGRASEYGSDFTERYASFIDLLSIDRVGSSFLVDLAIFALFQGWFVDDDLKRRGVEDSSGALALAGKYVPFFGMAAYLLLRPNIATKSD